MRPELFTIDTAILTTHTVIRRFREGDGEAFFNLIQNNSSYLEDHFPILVKKIHTLEDGESFVRGKIAQWLLQEEFTFGIWHNQDAELIGYLHFRDVDWHIPRADISYFLHHEYTGKGLMTEALARMIQYAFRQLKLNKIVLHTLMDNYASQRLARKVGFRREGDLRSEFRKPSGGLFDIMAFGLTREEYGE